MKFLTSLLLCLVLTSCATRYEWTHPYPASEKSYWVQVSKDVMYARCETIPAVSPDLVACAVQNVATQTCWMYSTLSEIEAKSVLNRYGVNVYEHEMRHCNGERH